MYLIEKLLSEKGKPMVVHTGYIYTQERTTTTELIFRCQIEVANVIRRSTSLISLKQLFFFN